MAISWKKLVGKALNLGSDILIPLLESKAHETETPFDDFAIEAAKTFIPVFEDGVMEDEETVRASISLFDKLVTMLEEEALKTQSPYDDAAVKSLRESLDNFVEASGLEI